MQCPNCGAVVENDSMKYCASCGEKVKRSGIPRGCLVALVVFFVFLLLMIALVGIGIWQLQKAFNKMDVGRVLGEANLHQIALGMNQYAEAYNTLPPAWTVDENGKPMHSWRVLILPYVGENELYEKIRLDEPWDSDYNKQFHSTVPFVLTTPHGTFREMGEQIANGVTYYSVVTGPETLFPPGQTVSLSDVKDGVSNTMLIVERRQSVPWMAPDNELTLDEVLVREQVEDPVTTTFVYPALSQMHEHCALVCMLDGSTRLINHDIGSNVLKSLLLRSDARPVLAPTEDASDDVAPAESETSETPDESESQAPAAAEEERPQ
ncbi:MAG: DUF1559 domain-containing protein [Planctomycetia bacterium]|nr:DUF1559 domain-containing protein [Planctomycetia bacterium]